MSLGVKLLVQEMARCIKTTETTRQVVPRGINKNPHRNGYLLHSFWIQA